jgi:hypothetical protein
MAEKGLVSLHEAIQINKAIEADLNTTRRELINIKVRATKKLDPSTDPMEVRRQITEKYGLLITCMPEETRNELESIGGSISKTQAKDTEESDESDEDDEND